MTVRLFQISVFCCLLVIGLGAVHASTWSDYLDDARALVAEDSERLNLEVAPETANEVRIAVEVGQTGRISKAKVISSSGDGSLDDAVLASFREIGKLPTPPTSVYFKQFFTPLTFTYVFDPAALPVPEPEVVEAPPVEDDIEADKEDEARARASEVVAGLQQALIDAGYDPGPVDGLFGNATAGAIRAWQAAQGLADDGVPTAALLAEIRSSNRNRDAKDEELAAVSAPAESTENAVPAEIEATASLPTESVTPPSTGTFSLNREIVEDYEYVEDRVTDGYSSF